MNFKQSKNLSILFANNYYYNRGGSEKVFFDEIKLLKENNFEVDVFSINDKDSLSEFGKDDNFIDIPNGKINKQFDQVKSLFWNSKTEKKIEELIKKNKFDILHMHNVHSRLSHSITNVAYRNGIKPVLTLHDHKYVCPNYLMM